MFFNESPKSEALSGDRFNHTVYRPLLARLKSKVELAFTETESASDIASKSLSRHTTLRTLSQTFDNGRLSFPSAKEYEKSIAAIIPRNLPTRYHLCNPSFARMSLRKPTISTIAELLESINALTSGFSKITYTADTPDMEDVVSSILSEFSNTDARSGSVRAF